MYLIGRKGHAREGYPEGNSGSAALSALRNRNVALDTVLNAPFTPDGSNSLAAILFTPKVSGVLQVSALLSMVNGADADTYVIGLLVSPGTGMTVTGGEATMDGWVMGSNTPPVIGGVTGFPVLALEALTALASTASGSLLVFGMTSNTAPLPIGVPVLISVGMQEVGSGHALTTIAVNNLSVLELP